jgi:hypothetical protein
MWNTLLTSIQAVAEWFCDSRKCLGFEVIRDQLVCRDKKHESIYITIKQHHAKIIRLKQLVNETMERIKKFNSFPLFYFLRKKKNLFHQWSLSQPYNDKIWNKIRKIKTAGPQARYMNYFHVVSSIWRIHVEVFCTMNIFIRHMLFY